MRDLRGKVAVVTGAASGIGRSLAARFLAEAMKVVLADVEEAALERTAAELGGAVLAVPTDVSRAASVEALAARAERELGAVHVVCNNAGVAGVSGPIWEASEADWTWTLGVNLWGVVHGIRAFIPRMIAAGAGHLVNTASISGLICPPMLGPYVASKHAVVAISEVLVKDLQAAGAPIGVSVLCPGWVSTNIMDAERNRPAELRNPAPRREPMVDALRSLVRDGTSPDRIADAVVAAIREDRFYVLPHPALIGAVQARLSDLVAGRTPRNDPRTFAPPPRQ